MESRWHTPSFWDIKKQVELRRRRKPASAERRRRSGAETIEALEIFIKDYKGREEPLRYWDTAPAAFKIEAEAENFRRRFRPLSVQFARYLILAIRARDIDGIAEWAMCFGEVVGEIDDPKRFAERIVRRKSLRMGPKKRSGGDEVMSARHAEWLKLYQEAQSKLPNDVDSDWKRYVRNHTSKRKADGSPYSQRRISDVIDAMTRRKKRWRKGTR